MSLPREESIRAAAAHILSRIKEKKDAAVALGTLDEELAVWDELCRQAKEKNVSLADVRFFAVCEFEGETFPEGASIRQRLLSHLIGKSDAREENIFIPDGEDCAGYDEKIASLSGLDLAVLGLGDKLAPRFSGEENVPLRGVTMCFQTLCRARDIIVIALGEEKAMALYRMLYGRDDSVYPAAFLQLPASVTVYADEEASAKL